MSRNILEGSHPMAIFEKAYFKIIIILIFLLISVGINLSMKPAGEGKLKFPEAKYVAREVIDEWKKTLEKLEEEGSLKIINSDDDGLAESVTRAAAVNSSKFIGVSIYALIASFYFLPSVLGAVFFGATGGFVTSLACIGAIYIFNDFAGKTLDQFPAIFGGFQMTVFFNLILTGLFCGLFAWLKNKNIDTKLDAVQIDYTKLKDRFAMVTQSQEQLQKQVSEQSEKVNRQSTSQILLYNLSRQIGSNLELKSVMSDVLSAVSKLVDGITCELLIYEKGFDVLRVASSLGHGTESLKRLNQIQIKQGEGMIGNCAAHKKLISKADVKKDFALGNLNQHPILPTEIVTPLTLGEELIGVINVSTVNKQCSQEDIRLLYVVSSLAAMAVKNAKFYMKIKEFAEVDGLTRMFNNRFFKEFLDQEIERSLQYGDQFSMLLSDIDHFKGFNDTYGHQIGDFVLADTAQVFIDNCRPDIDIAARYGGEEFCLVLPRMGVEQARLMAEKVRGEVAEREFVLTSELAESEKVHKARENNTGIAADGKHLLSIDPSGAIKLHVTVSIGVSTYPVHATTRDLMVKKADEALYEAKESGRNQVRVAK